MKAAKLNRQSFQFEIEEKELPELNEHDVLINLKAVSINHHELWTLKEKSLSADSNLIMGADGAGVVVKTGSAVARFASNDKVMVNPSLNWGNNQLVQGSTFKILGDNRHGCFAEYIGIPEQYVYSIPSHLSFEEAAAIPLSGLTAYRALFTRGDFKKGDKVLITGIGGGVALFALVYAVKSGAEVYVTSGNEDKINKAIALGAKAGVNYKGKNWPQTLREMAEGFDVIIDSAAGKDFVDLTLLANPGARIVLLGRTAGMITNLNPKTIFWKQLSIHGSTMGSESEFQKMITMIESKKISPVIDSIFSFEQINLAFEKMDKGNHFGKIVLKF